MKILRYLIKPLKLLVFLCLIAAVIYYRTLIFHSNVNQYIDLADNYIEDQLNIEIPAYIPVVNVIEEQPVSITTGNGGTNEIYAMTEEECLEKQSLSRINFKETAIKIPDTTADSSDNNKSDFVEGISTTLDNINKKIDSLVNLNKTEQAIENSEKDTDTLVNTSEINIPVVDDQDISNNNSAFDPDKTRQMARQSFWNGNVEVSEKLYQDLIKYESQNPDTYGELGNVYYAQGKWEQAGQAYYEAAIRLLDLNQRNQVSYLLRVIQGLDTASADKLRQRISG